MDKIKILLIDDEDGPRKTLAGYLELQANFAIVDYADGKKAMADLQRNGGAYTAVLLDYVLDPSMSGEQVLQEIQKGFPRLPVIVFSGQDPKGSMRTLAQGAYANLQRPLDRTEIINIIRELAGLEAVFMQMAAGVKDLLQSDVCFAWRLDRQAHRFRIAGWAGNADRDYCQTVTLDSTDKEWQTFLKRGEPLWLRDVTNPETAPLYRHREKAVERSWTSLITVPLVHQERVIGLIDSYSCQPIDFNDAKHKEITMRMLRAFAHQAAEAVRFTDLSQQNRALQEINQSLADTLEETAVLRAVLYKAVELVGADFGWLYMLDPATSRLQLKHAERIDRSVLDNTREIGEGITGWCAQKGEAWKVDDVRAAASGKDEPRHKPTSGLNVRSEISAPLRRGARTIGVLTIKSQFTHFFADDDANLLMSLATIAALAVERTKLTNHLQEVSRLALVAQTFAELAEYVVEAVQDLTGADVSLWMLKPKEGEGENRLRIAASRGKVTAEYKQHASLPLTSADGVLAEAIRKKGPVIIPDIHDERAPHTFIYREEALAQGWRSFMAVPMLGREEEPIGALSLYSSAIGRFDESEGTLMQSFANQAAIAFQQHTRLEAMQKLAQVGQSLSFDQAESKQLLKKIATLARDITGADCTVIYPYDPVRQAYFAKEDIVTVGLISGEKDLSDRPRTAGLAEIIRKHKAIVVRDVERGIIEIGLESPEKLDPEEYTIRGQVQHAKFVQRERIKAFVGISLRAFEKKWDSDAVQDEEEVGILYLNFRTPRHFNQEELRTIRIYAHQVANFTRGNRLLVRAQRQANELEMVRQIAIKILVQESLEALLRALVQEATRLLKGKGGKVYIRVPGKEQVQLLAAENVDHTVQPLGYILNFGEGLAGRVMQTKKPQIIQDYSQWEYRLEGLSHLFGAVIEVPLLRGEEAIGVLAVFDEAGKQRFTEDDFPILERLAQQAALAIYNASLVEQERILRRQAETLQEVSRDISANLNLREVTSRILEELGQVILYDKSTIQLIKGEQRELLAHRGFTEEQINDWLLRPISQDELELVCRIVSSQEPLILSNLPEDAPDEWEIRTETADIKSWVGLPLVYGDKTIGFMTLDSYQPGFYTQAHKNLLTLFANQAAIAIQNALLYEEARRRIRDLEIVGEIARVIGVKLELNELLRAIAAQIVEHLACAHCTIFMPEYENGRLLLVPKATYGQDGEKIRNRRFAPGEGIAGRVYLDGRSRLLKDAAADPDFTTFSQNEPFPRSLLVVPIKLEKRIIGVLSADKDEFDWFDEQDQQLVETLVQHVAMAIQNAQFVRRERAIREVASAISANLQIGEVAERILDALHRIIEYHNAGIQLVEGGRREQIAFRSYTGKEPDTSIIRPVHEDPLIWPVFTSQEMLILSNTKSDPRFGHTGTDDIGSWACVPLIYGLETVGTMTLDHHQPGFYTEEMQEVLSLFADQATIAIQNVLYFEKLQQPVVELQRSREAQIAAIGEIARSIAGRADLQTALNAILDSTISLIRGVRLLGIHLLNAETDELVLQAFRGPAIDQEFRRMSTESGIVGWVFRNKQSQIVADVREDERYKEILKETRSKLVIPLLQEGEAIGVLNIEHPQVNAFTDKDKQLAEAIAGLIVVAMQNAQQYQQLKKSDLQLKLLQEISSRISTNLFSLHEVLELVVENLRKIFTEAHCVIRLYDATASAFDKPITASFSQDAERIQNFAPRHNGISQYVVETGEPYFVENASATSHHGKPKINKNLIRQGIRSSASLPLQIENQVIGVLYLNLKIAHKFSESERKILSLFADQAAIAVWKIQQTRRRIEAVRAKFNPYIVGAPILKTEGFFGRKHFLEDILGSVHNNHFLIYGERRIGKTSLLYQLDYLLGSTVDPEYRFIPVVCSLEGISANQFFGFLIKQIVDSIPGTKINLKRKSSTIYNHLAFEEDFKKVIEYLQREIPDKDVRVVLLLDEMDQFLGYEHTLHQRFRSLLTTPISLFLKVIMFGVHIQRMHQTLTSPWYNLFKELELHRLKKSEARQLLIEYVRGYYSYEPEALKLILKYSDLKPLQVQRLGYYSVKSMLERNEGLENLDHLEAASDSFMLILRDDVTRSVDLILEEKMTEYQELWERFDEQQREMLAQAARKSGEIDISATWPKKFLSLLGEEDWQHAPPIYGKDNRAIRLANLFAEWIRRFK